MGEDYLRDFDAIFPDLAAKHGLVYYPFFLEGVATQAKFSLQDGFIQMPQECHKSFQAILPKVEELIARVRGKRGS